MQASSMKHDPELQMLMRNRTVTHKLSGTAGGETSLNPHAFKSAALVVRSITLTPSIYYYSTQQLLSTERCCLSEYMYMYCTACTAAQGLYLPEQVSAP